MQIMIVSGLLDALAQYPETVANLGFAIGTAIVLVIIFGLMLLGFYKFVTSTITKRLDGLEKAMSKVAEGLIEFNSQSKTALNIILNNRLNGDTGGNNDSEATGK